MISVKLVGTDIFTSEGDSGLGGSQRIQGLKISCTKNINMDRNIDALRFVAFIKIHKVTSLEVGCSQPAPREFLVLSMFLGLGI